MCEHQGRFCPGPSCKCECMNCQDEYVEVTNEYAFWEESDEPREYLTGHYFDG